MATRGLYLLLLSWVCCAPFVGATTRVANVSEVQPSPRDVVHTVWLNGPTHSGKISSPWPDFGSAATLSGNQCADRSSTRYTGYNGDGSRYCEAASPSLDNSPYLLIHSGRLGIVVDAGGLKASVASNSRNLVPKLGAVTSSDLSARDVYDALASNSATDISLALAGCSQAGSYVLGVKDNDFVKIGLVRQGHTVTQVSLTGLEFQDPSTGDVIGACAGFVAQQQPNSPNCNGFSNWPCSDPNYPECVGFVQGQSWGKCYNQCTAGNMNNFWAELSVWGDAIMFELAWDAAFDLPSGASSACTATVTASFLGGTHTKSASATAAGRIAFTFETDASGVLVAATAPANPIQVTSTSGSVVQRSATMDTFIEVPTSTPKCGYNLQCATIPLQLVDITATNPSSSEQTLRLSFSRNFQTREAGLSQSRPGSEITGLSCQMWDTERLQATGLPMQISKNWHAGSVAAYWAGFDGTWWTCSSLVRLPAGSSISLSLALSYERYGGISAWSHAQLSIVGYSDKWLWEQAALGSGGENICFDPLGSHTRAFITDVRPKLFDGKWKENVGGGDFLQMFGADGKLLYQKELDPQLHTSGPCMSDAEYSSVTLGGEVQQRLRVRGTRTDDLVRVFLDVRLRVLQDTTFSRLVFFQLGSETYSYHAAFARFVWGSKGVASTSLPRTCSGSPPRSSANLYAPEGGSLPFRVPANGTAPWWFAFEGNTDAATVANDGGMVVGDRGLVIRSFSARLGGQNQQWPSFSVLCDKIELGTPRGLTNLVAGDFVNMSLELLVLPREGDEFNLALANTNSRTLTQLASMTTSERVRAQAEGGDINVTAIRNVARVVSTYPVEVEATISGGGDSHLHLMFEVQGAAIGFVPVTISGLPSHVVPPGHGLWLKGSDATSFSRVQQGQGNEFWQVNFNRASRTYDIVFNIELFDATTAIAFGSNPMQWPPVAVPASPSPSAPLSPSSVAGVESSAVSSVFTGSSGSSTASSSAASSSTASSSAASSSAASSSSAGIGAGSGSSFPSSSIRTPAPSPDDCAPGNDGSTELCGRQGGRGRESSDMSGATSSSSSSISPFPLLLGSTLLLLTYFSY